MVFSKEEEKEVKRQLKQLIAESDLKQKETLIRLVMHLLVKEQ